MLLLLEGGINRSDFCEHGVSSCNTASLTDVPTCTSLFWSLHSVMQYDPARASLPLKSPLFGFGFVFGWPISAQNTVPRSTGLGFACKGKPAWQQAANLTIRECVAADSQQILQAHPQCRVPIPTDATPVLQVATVLAVRNFLSLLHSVASDPITGMQWKRPADLTRHRNDSRIRMVSVQLLICTRATRTDFPTIEVTL